MVRYVISKEFRCESVDKLIKHDGKFRLLHGHNCKVLVRISADQLIEEGSKAGMVMDFGDLKKLVQTFISYLDHGFLNEILSTDSPTAEYVAAWLFQELQETVKQAGGTHITLENVRVYETDDSYAEVSGMPVVHSGIESRF